MNLARALRRLLAVATAVPLALTVLAAPALAHGRGSDATNYKSRITDAPPLTGVQWRIYGADEYLAVTNTTDEELVIPGYQSEQPYLRIGPEGVFVNLASPAHYLNEDRFGKTSIPDTAGAGQPDDWEKLSDGNSHYWHDHRIHWMSQSLPMVVTDESVETVIPMDATESGDPDHWKVPFTLGGEEHELRGQLRWVPPPSPLPWLGLALLLVAPALLGLRGLRGDGWVPRLARPAAAVLAAVSLVNVVNLVDDLFAIPLPWPARLVAALQTAVFIAIGLFGAIRAWQGREGAFTALGVGSGAIFVGQGILYLTVLGASQTASISPDWTARIAVALSLMQALPVGIVAVMGSRRVAAELPPAETESEAVPAT